MGLFSFFKNEALRAIIGSKGLTFYRMDQDVSKAKHIKVPDILQERIVVFSDLHRGDGGAFDHFFRNRKVFNSALEHYFNNSFKLVLCGDVEEGWGYRNKMNRIFKAYEKDTLQLEKNFHDKDRYYRVYGNHDDYWRIKKNKRIDKYLKPALGNKEVDVYASIIFEDENMGNNYNILITHGCQGHFLQDVGDPFARYGVKEKYSIRHDSTPKRKNMKFLTWQDKQENFLIEWTKNKGYLLIAGHTHRPNYKSKPVKAALEMEKNEHESMLNSLTKKRDIKLTENHINALRCRLGELSNFRDQKQPPSYFNAGCCIRSNMISCVEINSGKISVSAWLCPDGEYQVLDGPENLKDIFKEIDEYRKQSDLNKTMLD